MRNITILVVILVSLSAGIVFADGHMVDASMDGSRVEITVESRGLAFVTETIKVKKGTTVVLTYANKGGFHDWVLDEFDAATDQIGAGRSSTVEFVADMTGEFEFYCSVGNHRAQGMVGTFIVVD